MTMSAHRPIPLQSVLKSLLENPLNTRQAEAGEKGKCVDDEDFSSHMMASAFFGPTLWDKTLQYYDSFQLEYMDLDEFLLENGIPPAAESTVDATAIALALPAPAPRPLAPPQPPVDPPPAAAIPEPVGGCCMFTGAHPVASLALTVLKDAPPIAITPESNEGYELGYEPDPADLVLSSMSTPETFDPRYCKFSDIELKLQPIVKKACKSHVPDELKDENYWVRRKKNNTAAKRSRDARRLKENQIVVRASFLERENAALRRELADMRRDLGQVHNLAAKYKAQCGPI